MNAVVRALEEDIFQLCDRPVDKHTAVEKQRLYSRVGQFLMGSFDGHWWCHYPTLMTFMVRILELHPGPEAVRMFYDKMAHQLGLCSKCVDIYHSAMPSVRAELESEFTPASVKDFFHKISQLDAARIHEIFALKTGPYTATPTNAQYTTAIYEVLSHRRLWSDFRIIRVISKWFASAAEPVKDAAIDKELILKSCPGILQWLVSPDPGIRAWASSLVGKYGIADMTTETADGREWMKVLDEWMYILESGSFNTPLLTLDLPSTEELPLFLDKENCVKTPTNQILWAALDTIMQRMNENSLEALLESFDNLPDLVFNYLNDAEPASTNPQITFVICKCYGSLLKCLGHRYWNHTVHSPKVVLDLVIQHCQLPSWRVFVTKQLIELLPPLVSSMRPASHSTSEANKAKATAYFEARKRVLMVLLHSDHRPAHFNTDQVLCVATSKAVSTVVCDSYEPRLASSSSITTELSKRDDGALPETSLVDLSVIDSSFWWPIGPSFEDVEQLWINHLFLILINPENVASLVDHVAVTCSTVLLKHLSLAREVVYKCIASGDSTSPLSSVLPKKPIVTRLLERLCAWTVIVTIPVAIHGALFESIGGMAELMNVISAQHKLPAAIEELKPTLQRYESLVSGAYLERICEEVVVKGLANPLGFPIVAQHLTLCLLSPNAQVDLRVKRLLANAGANKAAAGHTPSQLESLLVMVHRRTEAYLRGILNLLQGWRLHNFALHVTLPTVKKVIFIWTKVFDMLGNDIKKALDASSASMEEQSERDSSTVNLQKVPVLLGDFIVRLLTELYSSSRTLAVEESVLIQCLDFGKSFWKFFMREDKEVASSKRYEGMVAPLVRCVEGAGGQSEKRRAAELLMTLLEMFVEGQTRINEEAITKLEKIKASSIESKKSTDFGRMASKLRQVSKSSRFFAPRPITTTTKRRQRQGVIDFTRNEEKSTSPNTKDFERSLVEGGPHRPMSAKAAAREQARLAAARSASSSIFEASSKKAHSFYDEDDFVAGKSGPTKQSSVSSDSKNKAFSISQVIKGMEQVHPGSRQVRDSGRAYDASAKKLDEKEEEEEEEEDDGAVNLAPVFFKIKNTQKAIPSSSLLPFFRHLLQVSMPALLTKEFETERSDRELTPPPLTFTKSSEYANAFLPLLLEECHNELQEGLRRCYFSAGKNNGHLMRYESEKPREGMRCLSFSVVESVGTSSFGQQQRPGFMRREKLFRNADVVLVRAVGNRQNAGIDFLGVVMISETERGKRRQGGGPRGQGGGAKDDDELVRILFLNDGELESVTSDIPTFQMEAVAASAIADTEWRVTTLSNVVTATREYVALRSVDMLPDHLRTTILTPNMYETTQTELLKITTVLDELRGQKDGRDDANRKIIKLLKRLDRLEVSLTDLRSTSIGKAVNKLRKHENADVKTLSNALKDKWTALMDKKDSLDAAPRYVSSELWDAIKVQYNQSQLQSIHSVLNNYSAGISLLQGPPGTGKTKTIMALLSGFLALKMPSAMAMLPQSSRSTVSASAGEKPGEKPLGEDARAGAATSGFSKFDLVREIAAKQAGGTPSTFSLSGTPASSRILRHSDSDGLARKPTAIQVLKGGNVRSRLEQKMSSSNRPSSADVVRRTLLGPSAISVRSRAVSSKAANVLLCAPSNGAVDELVLRIVTDGLMDSSGKVTKVRAPSVHPDAASDWLSIVRLGNPGEDAPDIVKAVCLPHIIKQELEIHPKTVELRELQERQRTLRAAIKDFHDKKNEAKEAKEAGATEAGGGNKGRGGRSTIAKTHTEMAEVSGKVRRLRDEVSALEAKMTAAILAQASIIACTLSKAGSGSFNELPRGFDALIIDEAAQAVELSTLVPIRERVARVVLVGDPKQLPATVKSVVAAKARFDRSLFERIADSGVAPSMLRVQYRMHPFLREFPSKRFYGGMLTDGASVMERVQRVCGDVYKHPYFQPFMLYDLIDTRESDSNGSKYNQSEAAFCIDLCSSLFSICSELRSKKWSVGFVSPYKEQVRVLRQEVNRCHSIPATVSIEVNTVDGFQGREKDVIIFSCVRASDRGGIGFLKDIRRLNVAITRARFCLFVVGSARTLRRDETWNALVESAQDRKLVIRARSSGGFAGVKDELDRSGGALKAHYEAMHEKLIAKKAPAVTASTTASEKVLKKEDGSKSDKTESGVIKTEVSTGSIAKDPVPDISTKLDVEIKPFSSVKDPVGDKSAKLDLEIKPFSSAIRSVDVTKRETATNGALSHREEKTQVRPSSDSHGTAGREPTQSHVVKEEPRKPSPHASSSYRQASPRDRSRSRGRDDRCRDDRYGRDDRNRRGIPPLSSSSASTPTTTHGVKRSPSASSRDQEPIKSARHAHDQRRRSRSRSRDRSSSSARRERDAESFSRNDRFGTDVDRRDAESSRASAAPPAREPERTAEQKHRDRQDRLRALRDASDTRVLASARQSSSTSSRIVQLVRSGGSSSATSGSQDGRPLPSTNNRVGGGSLLSSILGSSSQLASATSRVDKANARRD